MHEVSARFLDAVRVGGTMIPMVSAYRDGAALDLDLRVASGTVQVSASKAGPRARLDVELEGTADLWDALAPTGTSLVAAWQLRYVDRSTESVPLGTFDVDEQTLAYGSGGGLQVTAPDRWQRVVDARFETPHAWGPGLAVEHALSLVEAAVGATGRIVGVPGVMAAAGTWESDRVGAVTELLAAAGYEIYIDPLGVPVARPVPQVASTPVWSVDAGEAGTLVSASRGRTRQGTYNVVVVTADQVDGTVPWGPVIVEDEDESSPTYAGGPFGRRPTFLKSSSITSEEQAQVAARALLARVRGMGSTLSLTAAPNPALQAGDTVGVRLPRRGSTPAPSELHLIDSLSIPMAPGQAQTLATRATSPTDLPEGAS